VAGFCGLDGEESKISIPSKGKRFAFGFHRNEEKGKTIRHYNRYYLFRWAGRNFRKEFPSLATVCTGNYSIHQLFHVAALEGLFQTPTSLNVHNTNLKISGNTASYK
jgi:hypothetical protein